MTRNLIAENERSQALSPLSADSMSGTELPDVAGSQHGISRRKLLTMLGAAGVTVAASQLLSAGGTAYADKGGIPNHGAGNGNGNGNNQGGSSSPAATTSDCIIRVTIAELRSYTSPQPNEQYYVTDAGQEGHFRYDAADVTSPDNTGTVLVSTSGARFKRNFDQYTFNASWFGAKGNGVTNDTPALQAAINALPPEGGFLHIPVTNAFYSLETGGLWLSDRSNIHISSTHAILKIKAGVPDTPKLQDSTYTTADNNFTLLYLQNCTNMSIEGLQLNGNISSRTAYAASETWQSCLKIKGCTNVVVRDCFITEGMTDGITVTATYQTTPVREAFVSKNILIDSCTVTKCRRNNISLIAQDGVTVSNCIVDEAGTIQGISPKCGIDVEPNPNWGLTSQNIVLRGNTVKRSAGAYQISFGGAQQHNMLVEGNTVRDSGGTALNIETGRNDPFCTKVIVTNNVFTKNKYGMRVVGKNADLISNNIFLENEQIGIILYSSDGLLITGNKFTRNNYAGIFNSTADASLKIRCISITNNWFEDNASIAAAHHSCSVKLSVADANSLIVFDSNKQINTASAPLKMKGVVIDAACNAFANGNISRDLLDPLHPHDLFTGVGNQSL